MIHCILFLNLCGWWLGLWGGNGVATGWCLSHWQRTNQMSVVVQRDLDTWQHFYWTLVLKKEATTSFHHLSLNVKMTSRSIILDVKLGSSGVKWCLSFFSVLTSFPRWMHESCFISPCSWDKVKCDGTSEPKCAPCIGVDVLNHLIGVTLLKDQRSPISVVLHLIQNFSFIYGMIWLQIFRWTCRVSFDGSIHLFQILSWVGMKLWQEEKAASSLCSLTSVRHWSSRASRCFSDADGERLLAQPLEKNKDLILKCVYVIVINVASLQTTNNTQPFYLAANLLLILRGSAAPQRF